MAESDEKRMLSLLEFRRHFGQIRFAAEGCGRHQYQNLFWYRYQIFGTGTKLKRLIFAKKELTCTSEFLYHRIAERMHLPNIFLLIKARFFTRKLVPVPKIGTGTKIGTGAALHPKIVFGLLDLIYKFSIFSDSLRFCLIFAFFCQILR